MTGQEYRERSRMGDVPMTSDPLRKTLEQILGTTEHAEALSSGSAWRELCRALERAGEGIDRSTPEAAARGYRHLARFLAAGLRSCVTHDDPDAPVLQRMIDDTSPWGLDHPDCLYLYAALRPDAHYLLEGDAGEANVLDIQVNSGHFSCGEVQGVDTLAAVDRVALDIDADGHFRLPIGPGAERRGGLDTGDRARFLQIRQYFADWQRERPARLLLTRTEGPAPEASPAPQLVGRQLETLTHWIERGGKLWRDLSERMLSMPANTIHVHPATESKHGALAGQIYGMGHFRCGPDEAVIVQIKLPTCRHWNLSLSNRQWEAIDYGRHQSSLNQEQATLLPGGELCAVIAQQDPGYADWLDPAGEGEGTLALRLHRAAKRPEVEIRRVPLESLSEALPAEAPRVNATERRARLEQRRRGVRMRYVV